MKIFKTHVYLKSTVRNRERPTELSPAVGLTAQNISGPSRRTASLDAGQPPRRKEFLFLTWGSKVAKPALATLGEVAGPRSLAPDIAPVAGYLLARSLSEHPIPPVLVPPLLAAQQSLVEARREFPLGRLNGLDDVDRTNGAAWARGQAGEQLYRGVTNAWLGLDGDRHHRRLVDRAGLRNLSTAQGTDRNKGKAIIGTAAMKHAGAAPCQNFAGKVVEKHGPRMSANEMAEVVGSFKPYAHQWTRLRVPAVAQQPAASVIADAWADGPVILEEDAAREEHGSVFPVYSVDAAGAMEFGATVRRTEKKLLKDDLLRQMNAYADERQAEYQQDPLPARERAYATPPVLSEDFRSQLRQALVDLADQDSILENEAASVAKAMGLEPTTEVVLDIIQAAQKLVAR